MFKALLRLLSMVCLSVAVIMAVLDATRSIAAGGFVATPLLASWASVSPGTLEQARSTIAQSLSPLVWDPVVVSLLTLPGFVVFAILAGLLAVGGRRKRQHHGRFVAFR